MMAILWKSYWKNQVFEEKKRENENIDNKALNSKQKNKEKFETHKHNYNLISRNSCDRAWWEKEKGTYLVVIKEKNQILISKNKNR